MTADLVTAVLDTCRVRGEAPALTSSRGAVLSYRELGRRIVSTRDSLVAAGLASGDRMLFSVRPGPEGLVLALGAVAAGATVVFVDPGAGLELFAARVELAQPRWAAAESLLYAASSWRPARGLTRRRGLLLPDYAALPVRHVHSGRWLPGVPRKSLSAKRLARQAGVGLAAPARPDQDAVVIFTAGTTGEPKAVLHTRGSLGAGLAVLATRCAIGPGDTVHTDQFMIGLPALVAGARWTMPPYGFSPAADPARFARGLAGATHSFLVPADLVPVLDAIESGVVSPPRSLRCLMLGAAPVTPPLLRRAVAALPGVEILAMYGMTEIVPVAVATAAEKLSWAGGDLLGEPLPGVVARIDGGELVVSGPNLCRGYLGRPPMTEHATGDLAELVDGRIVLLGRKKDMIIRGKTNVYPGLYEPTVAQLPGVGAAVMIGVADEIGDERIVLAVTAVDGPGAAGPAVLSGHPLAGSVSSALPSLIDASALPDRVVVVTEIPTSGRTRKPDRNALRALVSG
jgi:acyl-CoA synthetase (AMP-forming)/AMP-acid ligase II